MFTYAVEVVNVVDGDTVDVDIDLGFSVWTRRVRLRLNRINAYEIRLYRNTTEEQKAKGIEGKAFLEGHLLENAGSVKIKTLGKGKYGRWIAEMTIGDTNVSDLMVEKGYAIYQEY